MRPLIVGAALVAALGLSACSTAGARLGDHALDNLQHCSRTYMGQIGGVLPPSMSVHITCDPLPVRAPKDPELTNPAADGP